MDFKVGELLHEFSTGFSLFRCHAHRHTGDMKPVDWYEVRDSYWIDTTEINRKNWRFPNELDILLGLVVKEKAKPGRQ